MRTLKHLAENLKFCQFLETITDFETESFVRLFTPLSPKHDTEKVALEKLGTRVENETKFYCHCGQTFSHAHKKNIHTMRVHYGESLHCCKLCGRNFPSRATMKYHIQYKHEGFSVPCTFCDKRYSNIWSVRTHIQEKHMGITYDCNQCDKRFEKMGFLTQHKNKVHEGLRYACTFCEHTTNDTSNIGKHLKRWHLNEEQLRSVKINPGVQYKHWYKVFVETPESKEKKKAQKRRRLKGSKMKVPGETEHDSAQRKRGRPKKSERKEPEN